jgi:hypothetical protein
MSQIASVYCLIDAAGSPMYVGQTLYDVRQRAYGHWVCRNSDSLNHSNPMLASWLRTLSSLPGYVVLDAVPERERRAAEKYYIASFVWAGADLLNRQLVPDDSRVPVTDVAPIRRRPRSMIAWRGAVMSVPDWLWIAGIRDNTFYTRLARGCSIRGALSRGACAELLDEVGPDDGEPIMMRGSDQ